MPAPRTCPRCGADLGANRLEGLCPRCLLQEALVPPAEAEPLMAVPLPSPGAPSQRFGDYELLEELGHGGMGVVFKARQVSLDRLVALKLIQGGEFASPKFVQRFQTEAQAAARLQHPHIVAIHEVGDCSGQRYFTMDYVEGSTLEQLVRKRPLPPRRAAGLVLRDMSTGRALQRLAQERYAFRTLAFSPEGRTVASVSGEGTACLWDVRTRRLLRLFTDEQHILWAVGFSSDSRRVFTGGAQGIVKVWEVATGRELVALRTGGVVLGVHLHQDERRFLAATLVGQYTWHARTFAEIVAGDRD